MSVRSLSINRQSLILSRELVLVRLDLLLNTMSMIFSCLGCSVAMTLNRNAKSSDAQNKPQKYILPKMIHSLVCLVRISRNQN